MDVWRIRPSGGSPEQLTERGTAVNFLAPLDSRTLLYVAREEDRSGPWLWALDVERKVTRRAASGLGQYTSVSASRDGRRVVATVANPTSSLWRVPLLDRQAEDRDVQPYPLPTPRALAPRFAGTSLFYLSSARDGRWAVAHTGRAGVRSLEGRGRARYRSRLPCRPTEAATAIIVRREGTRRLVDRVGGRQGLANVGSVARHSSHGRSEHRGLVAGRHVDRGGRPRRAGARVVQDPRRTAVRPFGSSPVRQAIPCGRRTGT